LCGFRLFGVVLLDKSHSACKLVLDCLYVMNVHQKISEAASLALHTMVYLAAHKGRIVTTHEIAEELGVSKDHLSKVLQHLAKAGYVKSTRGPKGGFEIGPNGDAVSLLRIYELIEGPIRRTECLLKSKVCKGDNCILGGLVRKIDEEFEDYLSRTKISDLAEIFGAK
jgi:Rrf2 family protein